MLRITIQSLIKQDYPNQELVFVDDGSTEILEPFIKKNLKSFKGGWKIIRMQYNSGPGIARKVGMQNCSGKYIQFIDSDDEPLPDKISKQVNVLEKNDKLLMTYGTTIIGKENTDMRILGKTNQNKKKISPLFPYQVYWTTSSILWRRAFISDESWYPLYGSEDLLFEFLNGLLDYPIMHTFSDKPLLKKWLHPKNISAEITSDFLYQLEILKCYDIIYKKLRYYKKDSQLKAVGELYRKKVMFFLIQRRYNEANYCIQMFLQISDKKLFVENIAFSFTKLFSKRKIYRLLRMYYWVRKVIRNKL